MNLEEIALDLPKVKEPKLDVLINVGKPPNSATIKENSEVLKDRCEYFRTHLNDELVKTKDGLIVINLPSISPEVFYFILDYIKDGWKTFGCRQDDGKNTLDRLIALEELGIQELLVPGQEYLIKNQSGWIRNNFALVYKTSAKIASLDMLRKYVLGTLRQQPRLLLNPRDIKHLEKEILIWLLKKEDIQMEELEIWQNVISWGIARNPSLGPKISLWTSEEMNLFGETIGPCIPLIRFEHISNEDFCKTVLPFQRFLSPEQQRPPRINSSEDTLNSDGSFPRLMRPKRTAFIDSTIISISHAALIASWIKHKPSVNSQVRTNLRFQKPSSIPYSFQLLYRASRDGFSSKAFHKCVDNCLNPTFTIIKLKLSSQIIGGFTSKSWQSPPLNLSKIVNDHESFIFSLCDPSGDEKFADFSRPKSGYYPFMFSSKYVYYGKNAIKLSKSKPSFGRTDLQIRDNGTCFCKVCDYDKAITWGSGSFEMEECEVFSIKRKDKIH
ncbi:serine-enriched protein [Gigaspora margarita]|uniref:Serine-enriched protein n=1 Tax=Gigaspora margarita TaxID=4874 RepID=A0A8H3X874_GIGMA|nr:serine-enriched protein [Gigaspora margarita]